MSDRCYRATVGNIPEDQSVLRDSEIPLFFSVEFEKESVPVPLVTEPLLRCEKCKAYLNPYVEIMMPGLRWRCNLCSAVNEVQNAFLMHERKVNENPADVALNSQFNREHFLREDLRSDIYELDAPDTFGVKTPDPPILCFVIDVSLEAQKLSVLGSVLNCVKEILRSIEYDRRTRFCFMFYSNSVYFLNRSGGMTVITGEIPMVFPDSLLFTLPELLSSPSPVPEFSHIEKYFEPKKNMGADILFPLKLARNIFRSASLFLFFSAMPNSGPSKLEPSTALVCRNNEYKAVAESLFRKNICVNLFVMTRANIEYATIGILAQRTGGITAHYSNYDGLDPVSSSKLYCDLSAHFSRSVGFGAVCRVRSSEGAVIRSVYGNFCQKAADLIGCANWNPCHALNFSLTLFNNMRSALFIQIAMIRTTKMGLRRIRVFNICVPVRGTSFYEGCDPNALAHVLLLDAFYYESKRRLAGGEHLHKRLCSIWKEIRAKRGQIPENLESLPTLVLACKKTVPLRPDTGTPVDFRAYYMYLFSNSHSKIIDLMTYPLLLNLNDSCVTPLLLSSSSLDARGLFLLDTGINMFFYIAKECDPAAVSSLFTSVQSGPFLFTPPENEFSNYVTELVTYLIGSRTVKPRFVVVDGKEHSIYSTVFHSYMYDDKMYGLASSVEYRKEIENALK